MTISSRAKRLLTDSTPPADAYDRVAADPWSEATPAGFVNLATAENHLLFDLLEPRLAAGRALTAADTHYQPPAGMASFRAELAGFLTRQRGVEVDPDHLVVLGGSTAVLDVLAYTLCEPGDGIVVPAPYYSRLDRDLAGRAGAVIVAAPMTSQTGFALDADVVERAVGQARGQGQSVRAVLLLSPNNPLGQVYDADTLADVAEVAHGQGLQLVVDEIYAGSVYDGTFVSAAGLDVVAPERLHLVWGFAKDFGISGFKVGVLHSADPQVRAVASRLSALAPASSDTQVVLRDLIADVDFVELLRQENTVRLAAAYASTTKALDDHGIGYLPAAAGLFVWLDLRRFLDEPSHHAETRLWQRVFDRAKVMISPGAEFHCSEPGWFRLCFAGSPPAVRVGLERLGAVLNHHR